MSTTTGMRTGWVRLGASTSWSMTLLGVGLSLVVALLIAAPMSELITLVSGATLGWWSTLVAIIPFAFLLTGVPLIILSNRPASVDLQRRLLRVGWRTISFDELRHVYRMPGGQTSDKVLLQLEITRGFDARLPLSSDALPDLTLNELRVLLAMLEQAPIEPKPGLPVHAPLGDELGARDGTAQVADGISGALMPFGRVAYTKPTVLLEVQIAIERRRIADAASGETGLPDFGDVPRATSALSAGLNRARGPQPWRTIMPAGEAPVVNGDYGRGLFGTAGGRFRRHQTEVEDWLRSVQVPIVRGYVDSRALGWTVVTLGLLLPWIFLTLTVLFFFVYFSPAATSLLWGFVASFFFWPLLAWVGVLLLQRARIRRYVADRSAAVEALGRGHKIPASVHQFFGAPFPERSYGVQVYMYGIVLVALLPAMGLTFIALGFGQVAGPYSVELWQLPLGAILTLSGIPLLVGVLRWQRFMTGQLARARVEWELLHQSSSSDSSSPDSIITR